MKRTPLYENHVQAGATMVDFGGWEMPVQYPTGIIKEHLETRRAAGVWESAASRWRTTYTTKDCRRPWKGMTQP